MAATLPQHGLDLAGTNNYLRSAAGNAEARERVPTATAPLGADAGDEAGGDVA